MENWLIMHAAALECGLKLGEWELGGNGESSWRVELVKGNAGELHAPEPTVIESVIKRWRAELLEVALQNCMH